MGIDKSLEESIQLFFHVCGFSDADMVHIKENAAKILPHLPAITDLFYEKLISNPQTAVHIEGRLEHLKATHMRWLESLLSGNYDGTFMETQLKIGCVHVASKIPPMFVASSMSYMRSALARVVEQELGESREKVANVIGALMHVLDLCHFLIDYAYEKDRLNRLTEMTGLSPSLLENLISLRK